MVEVQMNEMNTEGVVLEASLLPLSLNSPLTPMGMKQRHMQQVEWHSVLFFHEIQRGSALDVR